MAQGRVADGLEVIHHKALAVCGSSHQDGAVSSSSHQDEAGIAVSCSSAAQRHTSIAQATAASDGQAPDCSTAKSMPENTADSSSESSSSAQRSAARSQSSFVGSDAKKGDQHQPATASSTVRNEKSETNFASQPGCNGHKVSADQAADSEKLHLIVVDASSGDASLAMTCPPAAFVEQGFLKDAAACLQPEGVLAVNFVTRSRDALTAAYNRLLVRLPTPPVY